MQWQSDRQLSDAEHQTVSAAVGEAEQSTSGEIATIVADRSDHYGDIPLFWAGGASLLALSIIAALPDYAIWLMERLSGGWILEPGVQTALTLAFTVALAKFVAVWLILQWLPLRLLLTPRHIKHRRVRARAVDLFRVSAEARTAGRTGILIYLSMRERRAEIVADQAIVALVPPESWGDAMAAMIALVRQGLTGEGMAEAVRQVGALLTLHFPRGAENPNELPDRLIEL